MSWKLRGALVAASLLAWGCRGQSSEQAPIIPIRNMYNQPRYDAQEQGAFFRDGRTMRPQVAGAVAREMEIDVELATGRREDGSAWVMEVPDEMLRRHGGMASAVQRGQERFGIYCSPCHATSGNGGGVISQRLGAGPWTPPTLHSARLRHVPDGQIFATISNGIRSMPSYRHSIPVNDRWAIVAYVRALQMSQWAYSQQARSQQGARSPQPGADQP